jgi:beta-lactam-binding protein with PASTA domain
MSFKNKFINFFKEIWYFLSSKYVLKNLGIILGIFVLIFLLLFFILIPGYTRHGEEVKIIDITNLTVEQATKTLKGLGLKIIVADSSYQDKKSPGIILEQAPSAGSRVKPNRSVYVTVNSSQPPVVSIYYNQVIGQHLNQVSRKLKSMDLKIGELKYVPGKAQNTIAAISLDNKLLFKEVDGNKGEKVPTDAQQIPRGSTVNLVLYQGDEAEPKAVPNMICASYEEAMLLIMGNEFYIGTVHVDPSVKKDTLAAFVVKQSPRPSETASMGTSIEIWLDSKRPEECD